MKRKMKNKVLFVSLGCDKNLVDSEEMIGILRRENFEFTDFEEEADVIIVNSCCFIGDAKEESINTILQMAEYRKNGRCKALIVTGCLAQRYKDEIISEIEEVDAVEDKDRNWIDLKIYHNEVWHDPEITLNQDFCYAISKAYELTQELRRYRLSQESYEREKTYYIDLMSNVSLTKIDHSNIPEDEKRKRMLEFMKEEWEAMERKSGSND